MTEHSPFTPPPELVKQWQEAWYRSKVKPAEYELYIANCAAAWGADQELEACCKWLDLEGWSGESRRLRAAFRPKPPSLKEQALMALEDGDTGPGASLTLTEVSIIRRALEALPDD